MAVDAALRRTAAGFPTVAGLAALDHFSGSISDETIEQLLTSPDANEDELQLLLDALSGTSDPRALALAARLARAGYARQLWYKVYRYLASYPSDATDDVFIDYTVNDDGERPDVSAIVTAYFRQRG